MGVNAGQLNRRIQFQRLTDGETDRYGNSQVSWAPIGTSVPAGRRDVSDAERMSAGIWQSKLVSRFTIRATSFGRSIRRTDRLLHEGATYEIDGIKEVPPGRAFIEITAWTEENL